MASHVFVRIARRQSPNIPLFPFLHRLHIINTSPYLDFLDVLLSAALKTLELAAIPVDDPHYFSVLSFLECAIDKAPHLSTLLLGPGQIADQILHTSLRNANLERLELLDVGITMTDRLLNDIGSLQYLKTFVFRDNGTSTYCHSPDAVTGESPISSPVSVSKSAYTAHPPSRVASPESTTPQITVSSSFPALLILEFSVNPALIEDLMEKVRPPNLQTFSIEILNKTASQGYAVRYGRVKKSKKTVKSPPDTSAAIEKFLRYSIQRWDNLVSIRIKNNGTAASSLPSDIFVDLLSRPDLDCVEINGMGIELMDTTLKNVQASKVQYLHLPVHRTAPSITLERLRDIAEAFPRLKSFRCRIWDVGRLEVSPPLSHWLEVLTISDGLRQLERRELADIARYLDSMFPKIKTVELSEESRDNDEEWNLIADLLTYFQAVRKDEVQRLEGVM